MQGEALDTQSQALPFDVQQMLKQGIRVSQAEFGRMVGVSRNCVTGWKKRGLIRVGPDGKLNPTAACKELVSNADPGRLRAPLLRQVMESTTNAQARAEKLGKEVASLREKVAELEAMAKAREKLNIHTDDLAERMGCLEDAIASELGVDPLKLELLIGRHVWKISEQDLMDMMDNPCE